MINKPNPLEYILNGEPIPSVKDRAATILRSFESSASTEFKVYVTSGDNNKLLCTDGIGFCIDVAAWSVLRQSNALTIRPFLDNDGVSLVFQVYKSPNTAHPVDDSRILKAILKGCGKKYLIPHIECGRRYWSGEGIFIGDHELAKVLDAGYELVDHTIPNVVYIQRSDSLNQGDNVKIPFKFT